MARTNVIRSFIASAAMAVALLLSALWWSGESASAQTGTDPACAKPSGMVAWWPWNGDGKDVQNSNNAKLELDPTFGTGQVNQALQLDGIEEYAHADDSPSLNVGKGKGLTIETWIKPTTIDRAAPLVEWNDNAGKFGSHMWISYPNKGDLFANLVDTTGNWHQISTPGVIKADDKYQHVALTYDKTTGEAWLYLDGERQTSYDYYEFPKGPQTWTPQTEWDLFFGLRPSGASHNLHRYNGALDESGLFDRALSEDEIKAIYDAGNAGTGKCQSDTTPPSAPSTPDLHESSDTGASQTDNVTNVKEPRFTGVAEEGSTVELFDGTTSLGTATANIDDPNAASGNKGYSLTVSSDKALADGTHPITAKATNAANLTSEASREALSVKVDTSAPTVTPGDVNDTTWRNTPREETFEASDPVLADNSDGSGLENTADASFRLTASADSTLDANNAPVPTTVSKTVTDMAGNSTTRTLSALIDTQKPSLGMADNNKAEYNVCDTTDRPSEPGFSPRDALSGLNGTGTKSWTNNLAPSGVGSYSFKAQASDMAGNSDFYPGPTADESKTYKIIYGSSNSGAQSPINGGSTPELGDDSSRFKLGSTVPVKFKLMCGTTPIDSAVAKLNVKKADSTPDPGVDETVSTESATTGNQFRYDATDKQYILNLSTKTGYTNPNGSTVSWAVGTYTLSIMLDDGTSRSVNIHIRE